jgi:hypothetical protein
VSVTPDHDVIQALSTDRADQLCISVLPGRARRNWMVTNTHCCNTTDDGGAVDSIAISNEMVRRFIPRERLGELLGDPISCRMVGDGQRQEAPTLEPKND